MESIPVLFHIGPFGISETIVSSWALMAALTAFCFLATRRLSETDPGSVQSVLETVVTAIEEAIHDMIPEHAHMLIPFIGSLWIYLVFSNLLGVVPELSSPTGDLSLTSALALLVFFSVHWFGIRTDGFKAYFRHYLKPSPILLPFHLISELSRTIALAVRLFGNIASLELAALLVLLVAGFLVPIPILLLHIIEALVQAYIFGMLALVYIAGGIQSQTLAQQKSTEGTNRNE